VLCRDRDRVDGGASSQHTRTPRGRVRAILRNPSHAASRWLDASLHTNRTMRMMLGEMICRSSIPLEVQARNLIVRLPRTASSQPLEGIIHSLRGGVAIVILTWYCTFLGMSRITRFAWSIATSTRGQTMHSAVWSESQPCIDSNLFYLPPSSTSIGRAAICTVHTRIGRVEAIAGWSSKTRRVSCSIALSALSPRSSLCSHHTHSEYCRYS
jgi:hypothetical protein